MHLAGYNVFVMPKHGGHTVEQLLQRHRDAIGHIAGELDDTIGVYGEGLGGYVVFYLALVHAPVGSIVCQNAPAIMTEPGYHRALLADRGPGTGDRGRPTAQDHPAGRPPAGSAGTRSPGAYFVLPGLGGPGRHRRG